MKQLIDALYEECENYVCECYFHRQTSIEEAHSTVISKLVHLRDFYVKIKMQQKALLEEEKEELEKENT